MKKQLARFSFSLLMLVVMFSMFLAPQAKPVQAVNTPIPTKSANALMSMEVANPTVKAGDAFDLNVTISTDTFTRGAQCGLQFDPNLVELTGSEAGGFFTSWADANGASVIFFPDPVNVDNAKGVASFQGVSVSAGPAEGVKGKGTLLTYHMKAKANGKATFKLTDVLIFDNGSMGTVVTLTGVQQQDLVLDIGGQGGAALGNSEQAAQPQSPASSSAPVATAVRRVSPTEDAGSSTSSPSGVPWVIIGPVAGILVVGVVGFFAVRKK